MPKISVLMTTYNSQEYISEAIESILNQTFKDFEFIIINDGSTDKTAEIIKSYEDKRIKFIDNEKNQGLVTVLNQGLELCKGEYIARMDSDDISLPERFAKQVEYLDAHKEVGILGTSFYQFGKNVKEKIFIKKTNVTYLDAALDCPVAHPSIMMRKSVLDKYNLRYRPEYKHAEDYDLWARAIKYTKIENLPDVLLKYRYHATNISVVHNSEQNNIANQISSYMIDFLTDIPELKKALKKIIKLTKFYDPAYLSNHMKHRHPIRYVKLKRIAKRQKL